MSNVLTFKDYFHQLTWFSGFGAVNNLLLPRGVEIILLGRWRALEDVFVPAAVGVVRSKASRTSLVPLTAMHWEAYNLSLSADVERFLRKRGS